MCSMVGYGFFLQTEDGIRVALYRLEFRRVLFRSALGVLTKDGRDDGEVSAALRGLDRYLDEHRGDLHDRFQAKAPWWLPESVEDRIFHRLLEGARAVIDDMANDGEHQMRRQLDVRLAQLVEDLQTSPELQARGDRLAAELLEQPELRAWVAKSEEHTSELQSLIGTPD